MTAPTTTNSPEIAEIRDRMVTLAVHMPCHPGWSWSVTEDYRRFRRAQQDGTPVMRLEYEVDDENVSIYLVGVHDLGAVVVP